VICDIIFGQHIKATVFYITLKGHSTIYCMVDYTRHRTKLTHGLNLVGLGLVHFSCQWVGLCWVGLGWVGFGWTGLGWVGLG